jgi:insulysin
MRWPVPREKVISAPYLVWNWDDEVCGGAGGGGGGEKEMREILDELRVSNGRAVLMARGEEHEGVCPTKEDGEWKEVPWYGAKYRVVRLDEEFVKEVGIPYFLFGDYWAVVDCFYVVA